MSKTIIVSNRLPFKLTIDNGDISVYPSEGGLATGMKSIHSEDKESLWIGWSGLADEDLSENNISSINKQMEKAKCASVSLTEKDVELFYGGFSNNTIWPLFHYFGEYTVIKQEYWKSYVEVNRKFAKVILKNLKSGDKIWVHDYHLLLLPQMLKEKMPNVSIGFFLHIPFPSFEIFRTLPWRNELLRGMLGADLIGFHTFDYKRHFMSAVKRLLGLETQFNQVFINNRTTSVQAFPMGIDYEKFHLESKQQLSRTLSEKPDIEQELYKYLLLSPEVRLVLSIDRLDYTKGIASRIRAFDYFLTNNPEYVGKVTLIMLTVPSRADIEQYQLMKSEIDELVGAINAKYSSINWRPIWYFYRSVSFESLVALYSASDIALITPVRDGMNLVAKEYIAARADKKGVLILSEMAGASKEMSEAIIVNPFDYNNISYALKQALEMPVAEQIKRNDILQNRLKKYNVEKWANDFMTALNKTSIIDKKPKTVKLITKAKEELLKVHAEAKKRIIFLDYDGTLVGFNKNPRLSNPDKELYNILDLLSSNKNKLVIISGRDRNDLDEWFAGKNYCLIAEHGAWIKEENEEWKQKENLDDEWKKQVLPIMNFYLDRTIGSSVETKDYSIVWHYRNVDPELGAQHANELRDELSALAINNKLEVLEGNKIIEIKCANINKGNAANSLLANNKYDFIACIGDDLTDEYMFKMMPKKTFSIKVGSLNSSAKYNLDNYIEVRKLLLELSKR
ncbi:MAG: bifunctional alpha,alpha-trehalose-phosphate synthase (UDP-forming)/trehalose-phosphatase [Marinifilaceae bacterium]